MVEPVADLSHFGFLADGVVGHHVPLHAAPQSAPFWSNSREIHVGQGRADDVRLAILVQAALIAAGSFDAAIMLQLVGRSSLAQRYLALEARRAVRACGDRLPRRLLAHADLGALPVVSESARTSLSIAQGRIALPAPGALLGTIQPGKVLRVKAVGTPASTPDTEKAESTQRAEPALEEDEDAESSTLLKKMSSQLGARMLSNMLKQLLGMGTQRGAKDKHGSGPGEEADFGGSTLTRRAGMRLSGEKRPEHNPLTRPSTGMRYPEWDARAGIYRADHVQIEDFVPWDEERQDCALPAFEQPDATLQRQILRLSLAYERHRHQQTGTEIAIDDLVRLVVDLRTGRNGDDRIYRAPLKTRRDLGVVIMVDCSGSTADLTDGDTVLNRQLTLGWQMASALESVGDRVALYGFNSWGRERVHALRVKSFDDRMSSETHRRMALLHSVGFSRIGAALRHASRVVADQSGMPFKLVILITDGLSYDDGYEGDYGESDTRKAIDELRGDGVGALCLSVGGDADEHKLRRIFGATAFHRADSLAEIVGQLGRLLGWAMNGVARR